MKVHATLDTDRKLGFRYLMEIGWFSIMLAHHVNIRRFQPSLLQPRQRECASKLEEGGAPISQIDPDSSSFTWSRVQLNPELRMRVHTEEEICYGKGQKLPT
jgi:hypothetical protein